MEELCRPHYATVGRTSIPPGVHFRMLLVVYFEAAVLFVQWQLVFLRASGGREFIWGDGSTGAGARVFGILMDPQPLAPAPRGYVKQGASVG